MQTPLVLTPIETLIHTLSIYPKPNTDGIVKIKGKRKVNEASSYSLPPLDHQNIKWRTGSTLKLP